MWGERLRALCVEQGWPLLWALGANRADRGKSLSAVVVPAQRLLDARVCQAFSVNFRANMTSRCRAGDRALEALWQQASAVNVTARTPAMLRGWWDTLLATDPSGHGLIVERPLRPGQCEEADDYDCVGVVVECGAGNQCCACAGVK